MIKIFRELFWRWTRNVQPDSYDPMDDFSKSLDVAYDHIRERVAKGGPGWGTKE